MCTKISKSFLDKDSGMFPPRFREGFLEEW